MALYSLNHKVISKAASGWQGKTYARARYIVRPAAARIVVDARTGLDSHTPAALRRFCHQREQLAGKNGRIAECLIVALPTEATPEQRVELVQALAENVTKGQAPYIAALHDMASDWHNPHAHILLFDETAPSLPGARGRRPKIIGLSRKNALEELREDWGALHNRMMIGWGYGATSTIDHRSLGAQGKQRIAELHEGPAVRAMIYEGKRPTSKIIHDEQGRPVHWQQIDGGSLRPETNALVRDINSHINTANGPVFTAPSAIEKRRPPIFSCEDAQTDFQANSNAVPSSHRRTESGRTDSSRPWWLPSWTMLFPRATDRGKYNPSRLRRFLEALRPEKKLSPCEKGPQSPFEARRKSHEPNSQIGSEACRPFETRPVMHALLGTARVRDVYARSSKPRSSTLRAKHNNVRRSSNSIEAERD